MDVIVAAIAFVELTVTFCDPTATLSSETTETKLAVGVYDVVAEKVRLGELAVPLKAIVRAVPLATDGTSKLIEFELQHETTLTA